METRPRISKTEELFIFYKRGTAGSGFTALIDAIFKLDRPNRAKIALGYPELVEVCNRYNDETGYWEDLQQRFKETAHAINF
jgi:hypothetical protein